MTALKMVFTESEGEPKLFGDRGYIGQELFEQLWMGGVPLITKLKRNRKNKLMPILDKLLLRKRALIECVNDQ